MKIRWRQHEWIMVTVAAVSLAGGFLLEIASRGLAVYEKEFADHHAFFDRMRNLVLPDLLMGLGIYAATG